MRGLEASATDALDRRLLRDSPRPIAVALSGGGDSLALTLIADAWARACGRELLILTVDHRLQAEGAAWTEACAAIAERLGRPFRALAWEGDKPATGVPAAARRARHGLLAEAAREASARIILMGHTRDDLIETAAMRAAGSTTPDPREWSPSPVWPQGRGAFLLRPLLAAGRTELRDWLTALGETWIDDPANTDLRYARSRARVSPAALTPAGGAPEPHPSLDVVSTGGDLVLDRAAVRRASAGELRRVIAMACVCAGGGERLPSGSRVTRAADAIVGTGRFVSTLAGARIEADGDRLRIAREPGEAARGGLQQLDLPAGQERVWDGRFAITAHEPGLVVRAARNGDPVIEPAGAATVFPLVGDRFRAAVGLIPREPA
ncbi:MAG: tRNA lysidine(34) synthetase TilS [Phenylobacterium sp.]|uniref:tRNA lysidine(34) synthetase TilS n=1 Tax=Phenylobacterium sp. TaxID=1871053 RepID=UPI001A446082|nr:tRNA lysidine(34) synthetase TilS [Phenylobacterium sp.]MBL8555843.1 tRNA lysidine(34) synthetase TilS [Phenylobacterium sp.]